MMEKMNKFLQLWYDENEEKLRKLMHDIWEHPETAMEEYHTAEVTAAFLRKQGFEVRTFHAMDPENTSLKANTVYASYGKGKPAIGILGELDALPDLGNEAVPFKAPIKGPGHACGHNLINGCGVGAACALRFAMEKEGLKGKLVFIGCPAEESINGKVWLARGGFFDGLDVCMLWHPFGKAMTFSPVIYAAVSHVRFEFFGETAHGVFPWQGRSALQAAELMGIGVNFLREHLHPDCSVAYIFEDAGKAPNIIPDHASAFYYIRSRDQDHDELMERVKAVAEGAAMMTGTRCQMKIRTHCHGICPTVSLNRFIEKEAARIPPLTYLPEEYEYAARLHEAYFEKKAPADPEELIPSKILPVGNWEGEYSRGSTDVGDVSQLLPTMQLEGFGAATGIATHKWAMTACTGMGIGEKAAVYVSKIIAQSGLSMLYDPDVIRGFWEDFHAYRKTHAIPVYIPGVYE